jgi:DNA-binding NtrC family response regulator
MPVTVVLAVGLDTTLLEEQISDWLSAGLFITSAGSIREAIVHFKNGDFDLVLLGCSIPSDSRERLTFLLRASGSRVPVVCVTDISSDCDSFVDAIKDGSTNILNGIKEIMDNLPATYAQSSKTSRVPI